MNRAIIMFCVVVICVQTIGCGSSDPNTQFNEFKARVVNSLNPLGGELEELIHVRNITHSAWSTTTITRPFKGTIRFKGTPLVSEAWDRIMKADGEARERTYVFDYHYEDGEWYLDGLVAEASHGGFFFELRAVMNPQLNK
jgi:hypothetical protein